MTPDDKRRINNLAVRAALRSLARYQRVLAGTYRQWAREAEADGNLECYRTYSSEARRLFRDAQWNINHARIYHG